MMEYTHDLCDTHLQRSAIYKLLDKNVKDSTDNSTVYDYLNYTLRNLTAYESLVHTVGINMSSACVLKKVHIEEDNYGQALVIQGVVYLAIALFGGIVNAYITTFVVKYKKCRRKFSNVILLHMALTQLLMCIVVIPFYGFALLLRHKYHAGYKTCDVMGSISSGLTLLSLWTIVALNIDKYKTITVPLKHSTFATKPRTIAFILIVWLFTISTVIAIHLIGPKFKYNVYLGGCSLDYANHRNNVASIMMLFAIFLIPTLILFIFYSRIFFIARTHRLHIVGLLHKLAFQAQVPVAPRMSRPSSFVDVYALAGDRKAVISIFLIIGSFVMCYLPFAGMCLYEAITHRKAPSVVLMTISTLFRSHPLVNALVYAFHNKILTKEKCRERFKEVRTSIKRKSFKRSDNEQEFSNSSRPVFEI